LKARHERTWLRLRLRFSGGISPAARHSTGGLPGCRFAARQEGQRHASGLQAVGMIVDPHRRQRSLRRPCGRRRPCARAFSRPRWAWHVPPRRRRLPSYQRSICAPAPEHGPARCVASTSTDARKRSISSGTDEVRYDDGAQQLPIGRRRWDPDLARDTISPNQVAAGGSFDQGA